MNEAMGALRFRQQVFRNLKIELWRNRPAYPRELLPWDEGSTQIDATITWENPPTTIYIEAKYGSELSARTSGDDGSHGFPSDQLIRNIRVGLLECGWFRDRGLFHVQPRDFAFVLLGPKAAHPLVKRYRDTRQLRASIPHSDLLPQLPGLPVIGEISYAQIVQALRAQGRWLSRSERILVSDLCDYLEFKAARIGAGSSDEQRGFDFGGETLTGVESIS
jgi:hypothetical protein